jgi:exonuclease III
MESTESANTNANANAAADGHGACSSGKTNPKRRKISHGSTSTDTDLQRDQASVSCCNNNNNNDKKIYYHPSSFVTWNCNGFSTRAKYDRDQLQKLVEDTHTPDVICIQEARLKAAGPREQRGRPCPLKDRDSHGHVRAALGEAFGQYTPFWSLADKKYAGTLTLVRKTCLETVTSAAGSVSSSRGKNNNNNTEGCYDPDFVAFTPRSAIELMLRRFGTSRSACGLAETTNDGSASGSAKNQQQLLSPPKKKQQTSLTSFFAPKQKKNQQGSGAAAATAAANKRKQQQPHDHNAEGRFQFFFFPGMDIVQTYVPNNGTKEESFLRRRDWDRTMIEFVRERNQILQAMSSQNKKSGSGSCTNSTTNTTNEIDNRGEIDSCLDRKFLWCGK